ncbi:MAG: hypothetical protein RLY49_344 [Candidatus Parcubacteria bacterium]|jgi:poly-gamma-glutamate synthesis protein (capsule biosynthesis protein)
MKPKKELILIFLVAFFIPLILYVSFETFLYSKSQPQKQNMVQTLEEKIKLKSKPVSLLFVGDIMLDRTIRKDGEQYGYANLFSCLKEEFSKHDAVIGNLEGTITNFNSVSRDASYQAPESFRFTFDIEAVRALKDLGLSTVSLANNHIRDFGDEGIRQTVENASTINLGIFGDPRKNISQRFLIQKIGDTTFAFIPYNQFFGTKEQTFEDLKNTQSISDVQIIFAHWGDEYVPTRADIKELGKSFVSNGADLVIGAHPHVIQEHEVYKGVPIYYSLGNFIFDQYFQEDVQNGMGVTVIFENKKISTTTEMYFKSTRHKGTCMEKPPVP